MGVLSLLRIFSVFQSKAAIALVEYEGMQALHEAAGAVLDLAEQRVPYDTGHLSETGEIVTESPDTLAVVFTTSYAHILRAHPEWSYQGGRSGRWLDEALEDVANGDTIGESLIGHWPGIDLTISEA